MDRGKVSIKIELKCTVTVPVGLLGRRIPYPIPIHYIGHNIQDIYIYISPGIISSHFDRKLMHACLPFTTHSSLWNSKWRVTHAVFTVDGVNIEYRYKRRNGKDNTILISYFNTIYILAPSMKMKPFRKIWSP